MKKIVVVSHSGKGLNNKALKKIINELYGNDKEEKDFQVLMGYGYNHKCNIPEDVDAIVIKSPDNAYLTHNAKELLEGAKDSEPVYDYAMRIINEYYKR